MIAVSVTDLLQVGHPGFRITSSDIPITDDEIPSLLDFSRCLVERFNFYGDIRVPTDMFAVLCEAFQTLAENDEPEKVFPTRVVLNNTLSVLSEIFTDMTKAFPNDLFVRRFYNRVPFRLKEYAAILTGGDM